jgi:spore coat protein A
MRLVPGVRYEFAALLTVAIGIAVVWNGKPLEAQPQEEDIRLQQSELRAAILNGSARAGSDTVEVASETVLGNATDFFIPADYDGDGKNDHAVWTPTTATFKVLKSSDGSLVTSVLGAAGDIATVSGDYDGDGKADLTLYRPGTTAGAYSTWFYQSLGSAGVTTVTCSAAYDCGKSGDFVAPGDYNGDGKSDFVVQRAHVGAACATDNTQGTPAPFVPNADFVIALNGGAVTTVTCVGRTTDVVVPGDYDGDGKTDITVVRGVSGVMNWMTRRSSTLTYTLQLHGASATDFITQGDYDGDSITDLAVWRPSATPGVSAFFIRPSTGGPNVQAPHGQNGDYPVANWNVH